MKTYHWKEGQKAAYEKVTEPGGVERITITGLKSEDLKEILTSANFKPMGCDYARFENARLGIQSSSQEKS